jgi:hypothetical protein
MYFLLSSELAQERCYTGRGLHFFPSSELYQERGYVGGGQHFLMSSEFAQERCYSGRKSHFCCRRNWLSTKSLIIFCSVISFKNNLKMNENLKI